MNRMNWRGAQYWVKSGAGGDDDDDDDDAAAAAGGGGGGGVYSLSYVNIIVLMTCHFFAEETSYNSSTCLGSIPAFGASLSACHAER